MCSNTQPCLGQSGFRPETPWPPVVGKVDPDIIRLTEKGSEPGMTGVSEPVSEGNMTKMAAIQAGKNSWHEAVAEQRKADRKHR